MPEPRPRGDSMSAFTTDHCTSGTPMLDVRCGGSGEAHRYLKASVTQGHSAPSNDSQDLLGCTHQRHSKGG